MNRFVHTDVSMKADARNAVHARHVVLQDQFLKLNTPHITREISQTLRYLSLIFAAHKVKNLSPAHGQR